MWYLLISLAVRRAGGGLPSNQQKQAQAEATQELKARNAAGKQARSAPKGQYMRPHRVHTEAERSAANARKHAAELDDEVMRHMHVDSEDAQRLQREEAEEHEVRMKGINFDERRKKRGRKRDEEDAEQEEKQESVEAAAKELGLKEGTGKYFEDVPEDRLGDLTLVDPNTMKRVLGPPVRFAQHAMLLAQEQIKQGMPREQAVEYLGSLYTEVTDRAYANKALRQFGASTGILDIYPLEVMGHLMKFVPNFLRKVELGSFFSQDAAEKTLKAVSGTPIVLEYEPSLRIRGFAIKGGGQPGYMFEPVDPPGTYHLTFPVRGHLRGCDLRARQEGQLDDRRDGHRS